MNLGKGMGMDGGSGRKGRKGREREGKERVGGVGDRRAASDTPWACYDTSYGGDQKMLIRAFL